MTRKKTKETTNDNPTRKCSVISENESDTVDQRWECLKRKSCEAQSSGDANNVNHGRTSTVGFA